MAVGFSVTGEAGWKEVFSRWSPGMNKNASPKAIPIDEDKGLPLPAASLSSSFGK